MSTISTVVQSYLNKRNEETRQQAIIRCFELIDLRLVIKHKLDILYGEGLYEELDSHLIVEKDFSTYYQMNFCLPPGIRINLICTDQNLIEFSVPYSRYGTKYFALSAFPQAYLFAEQVYSETQASNLSYEYSFPREA